MVAAMSGAPMKEITKLRKRAEAVGCHVRIFKRNDYRGELFSQAAE
jgi:hypothetical protein